MASVTILEEPVPGSIKRKTMKKDCAPNGRRHGVRSKAALDGRAAKTVLTFESRAQVYCWSTDRGMRPVIKH